MLSALLMTLTLGAAPASAPTSGYALVVTNNRSLEASRADLHYADDDGAKYAQLFTEALGADRVTLLTQFDPESQQLFPEWVKLADPPSRANLLRNVAALASRIDADNAAGRDTELYFVFAGHGDVEHGQGYVDLLDAKLTARDLEDLVVRPLHARHLHLILDSCNSYFMLASRKPGGQRFDVSTEQPQSLLTRYPNVGALLSTSAEAVTYEWSEVQSGIFSYELRSGLRGAADVDGDGRVSYAEIAAFISNANRLVPNDLYRPKVFMGAPAHQAKAAVWTVPSDGHVFRIPAAGARRFTIRDRQGVRLLDVNKEDQTPLRLALPAHTSLSLEETVAATTFQGRPTVQERVIQESDTGLMPLPGEAARVARRGEAPIFASLFGAPFGRRAFLAEQTEAQSVTTPPLGITKRDVDRLRLHLQLAADSARQVQVEHAFGYAFDGTFVAAVGTTYLFASSLSGSDRILLFAVLDVPAVSYGALGTLLTLRKESDEHKLLVDLLARDISTEERRAETVVAFEGYLRTLAEREAHERKGWGIGQLITAGVTGGFGAYAAVKNAASAPTFLVVSGIFLVHGVWNLMLRRGAAEIEWEAYQSEPEVQNSARLAPEALTLSIAPVVLPGGIGASLAFRF